MSQRIHLFGASGSGTTTLGRALSTQLQISHLDADNYYWKRTDPPFLEKNERTERIRLIESDIAGHESWVLSGSICSWGDSLINDFTLAVFLYVTPSVRLVRLHNREAARYGMRVENRGDMYKQHQDFMAWAKSYDTASAPIRSFNLHEKWMKQLDCPLLRLNADQSLSALTQQVVGSAVANLTR